MTRVGDTAPFMRVTEPYVSCPNNYRTITRIIFIIYNHLFCFFFLRLHQLPCFIYCGLHTNMSSPLLIDSRHLNWSPPKSISVSSLHADRLHPTPIPDERVANYSSHITFSFLHQKQKQKAKHCRETNICAKVDQGLLTFQHQTQLPSS